MSVLLVVTLHIPPLSILSSCVPALCVSGVIPVVFVVLVRLRSFWFCVCISDLVVAAAVVVAAVVPAATVSGAAPATLALAPVVVLMDISAGQIIFVVPVFKNKSMKRILGQVGVSCVTQQTMSAV